MTDGTRSRANGCIFVHEIVRALECETGYANLAVTLNRSGSGDMLLTAQRIHVSPHT